MQLVQVKKSGFRLTTFPFASRATDMSSADRTSLLLKPSQLLWLKTLMASASNSSLTVSARAMRNCFFKETSLRKQAAPLPPSLCRLPLTSLKSTVSPLRASAVPLPLALPGARKVFTKEAHCAEVKPEDVHSAVDAA